MSTLHLFSRVASLIDRNMIKSVAKKHHSDKFCQNPNIWAHPISLLFGKAPYGKTQHPSALPFLEKIFVTHVVSLTSENAASGSRTPAHGANIRHSVSLTSANAALGEIEIVFTHQSAIQ